MKLKSFSHKIHYENNEFQHIELTLVTDNGAKVLRGVYNIAHDSESGMQFKTPAAVFAALYEGVLDNRDYSLTFDEPAMFQLQAVLKGPQNTFTFDFRELKEYPKQEG